MMSTVIQTFRYFLKININWNIIKIYTVSKLQLHLWLPIPYSKALIKYQPPAVHFSRPPVKSSTKFCNETFSSFQCQDLGSFHKLMWSASKRSLDVYTIQHTYLPQESSQLKYRLVEVSFMKTCKYNTDIVFNVALQCALDCFSL